MMNSNNADFANVERPTELIGTRGLAMAMRKDGSRRTSAVQWSMNGAAAPAVQPPAPNSAVPADLQPFVSPPSLTGGNAASLLAGHGGGLMGVADPLCALVKPSEAIRLPHSAGAGRLRVTPHESDPLNGVEVRSDLHHLTRGHDP